MADVITTLHPEGAQEDNLYPNVKDENIPSTIARKSDLEFKSEVIYETLFDMTNSFSYLTGANFTISEPAIVEIKVSYGGSAPKKIGVGSSTNASNPSFFGIIESFDYDNGSLTLTAFLEPGTYGVWVRAGWAGNNWVRVRKWTVK